MRKTATTSAIAAGLVVLTTAVAVNLGGAGQPVARAQGGASPCTLAVNKVAAPAVVPLGYATQVTLTVRPSCPPTYTAVSPLHIALVVDNTASMDTHGHGPGLKAALQQFIRKLDLANNPTTQVALVTFGTTAISRCKLTNDTSRLISCAERMSYAGEGGERAGLQTGVRELVAGRPRGSVLRISEVIILVADGPDAAGCEAVLRAAGQAKSQGILMLTIALGPDADQDCLRRAASSARYYFEAADGAGLMAIFDGFFPMDTIPRAVQLRSLVVHDILLAPWRLVPDSARPAPASVAGQDLEWRWSFVAQSAYTITYWAQSLALGDHAVNYAAAAEVTDWNGLTAAAAFPVPRVRVVDGAGRPTPTAFPTPTALPITPSPTAYVPPTPTPLPVRACPGLTALAPAQVIADALANPARVGGYGRACNPSLPIGPHNPPRTTLGLQTVGKPFHPLFNGLVFKCGCP